MKTSLFGSPADRALFCSISATGKVFLFTARATLMRFRGNPQLPRRCPPTALVREIAKAMKVRVAGTPSTCPGATTTGF
ncbi:MAG: hypothetical protein CM15mP74_05190 [Halieaceae bacterium]|nr:MAG: hypothetical protein CM15mP74_05190 [Halieaceae bacterium]